MPIKNQYQSGISLIELIIFIVIVSIGVAGILSVMNVTSRHSADPLVRKQAIAAAESLLEEVFLHPFTYCDPSDANFFTANGPASPPGTITCATAANNETALTFQAGETRYANASPFDNVGDYNGFATVGGIVSIVDGTTVVLPSYNAQVTVTAVGSGYGLRDTLGALDNTAALRIDVRVIGLGEDITVSAFRFRYAPNFAP